MRYFCVRPLTCYNAVVKFLYPLLVGLVAMFAIAPLEYPGAFQSHTGLIAAYNLINLDQNPWQFLTWAPAIGRAYDLLRNDGALPYLISELFHLIGLNYLDSIKLVYALAWVASGLAMYGLARRCLSQQAAFLAATLYVYLPFHIAAVYVRGAFAESVAWALFPVALHVAVRQPPTGDTGLPSQQPTSPPSPLLNERGAATTPSLTLPGRRRGMEGVGAGVGSAGASSDAAKTLPGGVEKPTSQQIRSYALSILPFALLFITLPGLSVLFGGITLALAVVLRWREAGRFRGPSVAVLGGLGLGTLLALPSILSHGASIDRNGFVPNFVLPFQLFSSQWGFGVSTGNFLDQFPLQIGVVPLVLAIFAIALGWNHRADGAVSARRRIVIWLAAACLLALLTFETFAPLWRLLGLFVTYPWQLLAVIGLLLALAAATTIDLEPQLARPTMLAFFIALPVVATYGYLTPRYLDFTPTRPLIAVFGNNEIALLDYRIVGPLRHGATVRLEMQWQALRPIDHDYTVFVHAVDEEGQTFGQVDEKPVGGTLPTLKWTAGQVISDTHTVQIDVDGPREGYLLHVGLYYGANGQRALLDDGSDHLELPRPQDPEPTISDQLPVASSNKP
jgi:hypothetical protein